MVLISILSIVAGGYILFYSLYWFALSVIGLGKDESHDISAQLPSPEILVVLPAYKPGKVFIEVMDSVQRALEGRPSSVFVLLQDADASFTKEAAQRGFFTIEKSFSSLPGNSYQHALRFIATTIDEKRHNHDWNPEFVMLVDKDNLLSSDFFSHINAYHYDCFDVIQGRRCPQSNKGFVAFFDEMSEKLNDTLYRTAKQRLGLPIEISGSGALIETDLFIRSIHQLDPKAPGFDKNFMVQLLTEKRKVAMKYLPACTLWEEKTSSIEAHNPQRLRWFGEQYFNAIYHAKTLFASAIENKRISALDYWMTLARPPRSLHLAITPIIGLIECLHYWLTGTWFTGAPLFTISAVLLIAAVVIFLIAQESLGRAILYSGQLFKLALNNLLNASRSIQKENLGVFIHTDHKQ